MKVVRVEGYIKDYVYLIPLEKVDMIVFRKDRPDYIMSDGEQCDCFGGRFAIYNLDEFEGSGI